MAEPVLSSIALVMETLLVQNGRKLGRLNPDEDGYYCKFPIGVLGLVSQNNTKYSTESVINQIQGKDSFVKMALDAGQLYGEYGHPYIIGMSKEDAVARILDIRASEMSHHIRKIELGESIEDGKGRLIVADIKPHGRYKEELQDNFSSKFMNTAFSLRSITKQRVVGTVMHRDITKLVTFDYVPVPGFAQASKRYAPGVEGYVASMSSPSDTRNNDVDVVIAFDPGEGRAMFSSIGLEHFTQTELNETLGTDSVIKKTEVVTIAQSQELVGRSALGARDTYHAIMRGIR